MKLSADNEIRLTVVKKCTMILRELMDQGAWKGVQKWIGKRLFVMKNRITEEYKNKWSSSETYQLLDEVTITNGRGRVKWNVKISSEDQELDCGSRPPLYFSFEIARKQRKPDQEVPP